MSRLEKFINENRDAFDDDIPSDSVWQGVETDMAQKNKAKLVNMPFKFKWGIAASVIILAGIGIFFKMRQNSVPAAAGIVKVTDTTSSNKLAAIAPEDLPEMNQFAKLIALKQDELKKISKEQPELYQKFTKDINQLDSTYTTLQKQLSIAPNRELLIEAMIQNLQLQLQVLNQQLKIINQIKNSKNNSHEKNEIFM
jgi:uncharacterized membrane protein YdfJ with MMPL/SSD domain